MRARFVAAVLALAVGGCAMSMPGWVPYLGKKKGEPTVAQPPPPAPAATRAPVVTKPRPPESEDVADRVVAVVNNDAIRSEEHTSELQSLTNLVCRLLLEKKKEMTNTN